ncbi:MAG: type III-A CRISPR-associated RAMP protein Csm3 [Candidatus Brocadia sp.]|nr:type III-A CRISPR-associated RAMP protein Csm3 [Candidatus Brocadia sp.]
MKLKGYRKIEGIIEIVTGLHIGSNTDTIEIGGKDNPVIKHPVTKEPYIPGSSIKGKMRSLLEWKLQLIDTRKQVGEKKNKDFGEVHKFGGIGCRTKDCPICVVFGTSADNAELGPTRLVVRDAFLCDKYRQELVKKSDWSPFDLTEDKSENSINRITARANPRNMERVIPGAKFLFKMSYRVFERDLSDRKGDNGNGDEGLFSHVLDGLRLIEKDTLGGAGSRGCGQVSFKIKVAENDWRTLDDVQPTDFNTDPVISPGAE